MINYDNAIKQNKKEHNPNWPEINDQPYRILIIGGSGSVKKNSLFNLRNKFIYLRIYFYAKNSYEAKYLNLINKRETTAFKYFSDSKFLSYMIWMTVKEY